MSRTAKLCYPQLNQRGERMGMAVGREAGRDTTCPETTWTPSKAARQRRLWRGYDISLRSSGLVHGRPAPVGSSGQALQLPPRWLTARELIGMARAARSKPQN
jgi:hypothetical protein